LLDRERCILCDRCTRFADEVAGDALIHFTSRGNNTQVQTFPDEPFSSYFSGNTVQICPVGALTAQPYRFKARPWDLEKNESTCTTCSVGCRITVESSRDELLRYQGVDSDPVNHGWLCDKGRFNFESVKNDQRLTEPMVKHNGALVPTSWSSALSTAANLILQAVKDNGAQSVAIIGGARGTNEDAYAWSLFAQALGVTNVDAQLDDGLPASVFGYNQATID
jgi:NADH-quinone oxidoreductase subunit G